MGQTRERIMVDLILAGIADKQGQDPVVLDLKEISSLCDYFVITSASSIRQVKAMAESVKEHMEEQGYDLLHHEGFRQARWILLDYGDVVVHLFVTEERDHYQLERIWKDAPLLDIDSDSGVHV